MSISIPSESKKMGNSHIDREFSETRYDLLRRYVVNNVHTPLCTQNANERTPHSLVFHLFRVSPTVSSTAAQIAAEILEVIVVESLKERQMRWREVFQHFFHARWRGVPRTSKPKEFLLVVS